MKNISKKLFLGITLIFIMSMISISVVSASTITVIAKPSASNNLPYKDHTKTWENYCPLCHSHGTLVFNPKKTYEGELTCSNCGADYCGVTGKDKSFHGSRAELIPFKEIKKQTTENIDSTPSFLKSSANYLQLTIGTISNIIL
ncbi:hypothetical protein MBCUT_17890 [Methanobrevibacter cuticularis]|uniref:Uncharacterized protein n=1 Tax=Methanobrevibacter cuticularis TaxID=47311 RepID=A0A166CK92_9EURY|nr:hypothetical protein [Methanobrevibacter cuticularis]KZX14987.1 hypothetical protein MBCUT_17890 [Methanobrevibacter cuticularis]